MLLSAGALPSQTGPAQVSCARTGSGVGSLRRKGSSPRREAQVSVCIAVVLSGARVQTAECGLEPLYHGQNPFGLASMTIPFLHVSLHSNFR